jgi:hypothetical protein
MPVNAHWNCVALVGQLDALLSVLCIDPVASMMIATFHGVAGPDIDENDVAFTVRAAQLSQLMGQALKTLRKYVGTVAVCETLTALHIV